MTRMRRFTALLVLLACLSPARADRPPKVSQPVLERLEQFFGRYAKSDGLDAAGRQQIVAAVRREYGALWARRAMDLFRQADADRDGTVTRAEWGHFRGATSAKVPGVRTFMVAMSDGAKLATDVHLPAGDGPFPVALVRTPYGRKRMGVNRLLVLAGYAYVVQDTRGRFDSEGQNHPFVGCGWHRHRDGADTIAWVRRQGWCNGRVGTLGGSAMGITQNLTAGAAPEALTSQYIQMAAASLYHHGAYVGGALREEQAVGWIIGNRYDPDALRLIREHPNYDAYWYPYDSMRKFAVMNAPAVHVGGWFDTFAQGTIDAFVGRQYRGGPGARGRQKLVMGPWTHAIGARAGQLSFPDRDVPELYRPLPWLEATLKGKDPAVLRAPAVAYYVMGDVNDRRAPGNEWCYADRWPIPAEATAYFFQADGSLSRRRSAADAEHVEYTFDPHRPCPTVGGGNLRLPSGPHDQRRVERRDDVLTFTTEPLEEPVEVTGRIKAKVWISSSAVDTDLSVRFCDVYPDGKSYLMAEGMLRLRHRESMEIDALLEPGKVYEIAVDCWSTSVAINKGHRIRVAVTSSNHPRFDVNPGTSEPFRKGDAMVRQTNRIYLDRGRPSHILLPVVAAPR